MKCNKCGFENESHSKFCVSCGYKLSSLKKGDTQPMEPVEGMGPVAYYGPPKKSRLKALFIGLFSALGLVAILILVYIFFLGPNSSFGKSKVYKEVIQKGQAAYRKEDYQGAIDILALVPQDGGQAYQEAANILAQVEDDVVDDIEDLYDQSQYQAVLDSTEEYLEAFPDNRDLKDLAKKANNELKSMEEEGLKAKEAELEAQIEAAKKAAAKAESAAKAKKKPIRSSGSFLNTHQTVQSSSANVRSGPSLDSPVIYSLEKGDGVYVSDTIESGVRTWCFIGDGWISSRTLTGEL